MCACRSPDGARRRLVDVGVVARGAQELPAIHHLHVRALANPDGSAVRPPIDAQRPQRGEKAQELLSAPGHAAAAGAAHLARATDAIVSEAEQAMALPVPRGKTAKRIACLALRREEPERFAFEQSRVLEALSSANAARGDRVRQGALRCRTSQGRRSRLTGGIGTIRSADVRVGS